MPHHNQIPELQYLLKKVEEKYGRRIATTTDFESLSVVIEHEIGELVSASTLKRLWGYVSLNPVPRLSTLDVLSRYVGAHDFRSFCEDLKKTDLFESSFFTTTFLEANSLAKGAKVILGWAPDRRVVLEYMGGEEFEVRTSFNSKLREGDRFVMSYAMLGHPLYVSRILRDGSYTASYVAGRSGGLTLLEVK